jgi:uncharacterized delta-60 repeat protein
MAVCLLVALAGAALPLAGRGPAHGEAADLDPGYGDQGIAVVAAALGNEEARTLTLMPGGDVVVTGVHDRSDGSGGTDRRAAFVRFSPDGTPRPGPPEGNDGGRRVVPAASAPAPGGKLVVAAGPEERAGGSVVFRYLASGALDPGFGRGGVADLTDGHGGQLNGNALAVAVAVDGAVVVAGRAEDPSRGSSLVVWRLRPDGSADTAFADRGTFRLDLADGHGVTVETLGQAVAVLGDGRVLVAGTLVDQYGALELMARLTPAGDPDPRFGGGSGFAVGPVGRDWAEVANSLAVSPDGTATVAGTRIGAHGTDVFVRRHRPDGSIDPTFAGGGLVAGDPQVNEVVTGLALDGAGRAVVTGAAVPKGAGADIFLARYLPDGRPDPGFRAGQPARIDLGGNDLAAGVALDQGRIVLAATTVDGEGGDIALLRFTDDGRPDPSVVGGAGHVLVDLPTGSDHRVGMAVGPDGSLTTVGAAQIPGVRGYLHPGIVVRQRPDGTADPRFRRHGVAFVAPGEGTDQLADVAVLPDGSAVVVGGRKTDNGPTKRLVLRLRADGSRDPSFGTGGEAFGARLPDEPFISGYDAVAVSRDGRIVAVAVEPFGNHVVVARYLPDGRLDPDFGSGGLTTIDIAYPAERWDVAATADGGAVLTGPGSAVEGHWPLVKLDAHGQRDQGFTAAAAPVAQAGGNNLRLEAVSASPDGTVLVAGVRPRAGDPGGAVEVVIGRLTGDGHPDPRFDCDGYATVPFGSTGRKVTVDGIAVGGDGRIVVGGTYADHHQQNGEGPVTDEGVFAMRWLADGSRDTGLSGDGTVTGSLSGGTVDAAGIGLDGDHVVVAGTMTIGPPDLRQNGFSARFAAGTAAPPPEPATDRFARCASAALTGGDVNGVVTAAKVAAGALAPARPAPPAPVPVPASGPLTPAPLPLRVTAGLPLTGTRPAPARPESVPAWHLQ